MSPIIKVEGISKRYQLGHIVSHKNLTNPFRRGLQRLMGKATENEVIEDFWALRDINFEVKQGEVVGIIGKNGAGKSTLLKILSRITDPSEGRIELNGRVASLLEVGTGFNPELTGRENIFLNGAILGMSRSEVQSKFDEIVAFAGVEQFLDTPVKRYSSGMYVRLAFAVAAHLEPEILIIDEVLAVGDIEFQRKCLGKMEEVSKGGRTVLFVSHNMVAIKHICPKVILLSDGQVKEISDSESVVNNYLAGAVHSNPVDKRPAGFIYYAPSTKNGNDFSITGIQLLDASNDPLEVLGTWDYVKFRIHYSAARAVGKGSFIFQCQTFESVPLLLCSTYPVTERRFPIEEGDHHIDCIFAAWPLSEGRYVIGGALTIPNEEVLCWEDSLCEITVSGRDVYANGLAPSSNLSLVAADHKWALSE